MYVVSEFFVSELVQAHTLITLFIIPLQLNLLY